MMSGEPTLARRRLLSCGCAALGWGGLAGWSQAQTAPITALGDKLYELPERLAKPELSTDEGGMWAQMDREETLLKRSKSLIRDKALVDYVRGIACKLGSQHCQDMRVYVVRQPHFNAAMAPNGLMMVWSGLLLRASNEAQLASVLGHEIGHYVARHTLERLRTFKSAAAAATLLGGLGGLGQLAGMGLLFGAVAYTRDQERDADRIGADLLARNGYAVGEASQIWNNLLEEVRARKTTDREVFGESILFASHPPSEERSQTLAARAAQLASSGAAQGDTGREAFARIVGPYRREFAAEDLSLRRFAESEALYQRMAREDVKDFDAHFFLGEVYRARGADGDAPKALAAYDRAAASDQPHAERSRGRGLVLRSAGQNDAAREHLRTYIELKPDAADAALIDSYLKS